MDEDYFESWEVYAELCEQCDYEKLVAYCESEVERDPNDLHALERLGEAYVLNGDYTKAIRSMARCHHECPDIGSFQRIILDALFAMGKTENDFDWSKTPVVLRLDRKVCDWCYDFLRPKRKPRSAAELYSELCFQGYLNFSEDDLMQTLQKDGRFLVVGIDPWGSEIRVCRSGKGRTKA
jgi:tetratricopeptide (TPR) repeat protein